MDETSEHKAEQTKLGHKFVTKDLVPKKITTLTFDRDVGGRIIKRQVEKWLKGKAKKTHKLEAKQVRYLVALMNAIRKVPKNGSINVGPPPFTGKDVATIAKDYSEILAAIWCTTNHYNQGVGKVNIPSSENLPLADILVPSGKKLRSYNLVSIKTKKGSPTSFAAIWKMANKNGFLRNKNFMSKLTPKQKELIKLIEVMLEHSIAAHSLEVAKWMYNKWDTHDGKHFGLPALKRATGIPLKKLSLETLEKWMESFGESKKATKEIRKKLEPFYAAIERNADHWDRLHTQKYKSTKITAPLSIHLVDWLNDLYGEELTSLMNTFRYVHQVNVDLDMKGNLSVKMKTFPEMEFKFSRIAPSSQETNKIGFKKA
jgi:hypothetical protein